MFLEQKCFPTFKCSIDEQQKLQFNLIVVQALSSIQDVSDNVSDIYINPA